MTRFQKLMQDAAAKEEARWLRKAGINPQADQSVLSSVAGTATKLGKQVKSVMRGDGSYSVALDRGRAVRMHQSPKGRGLPVVRQDYGLPPWAPGAGVGLLLLAAAVALQGAVGRTLGLRWRWGRAPEKGRWVRDRSLGGKLVFMSDSADTPPAPAAALISWDVEADVPRTDAGLAVDSAVWRGALPGTRPDAAAGAGGAAGPPEWWRPPSAPLLPVGASTKEQAQREAKRLISGLEDAKMVRGVDYEPYMLVQLYNLCKANSITARPRATNSRDAMFRAAVARAISAAAEGGAALGQLSGVNPAAFVSGMAEFLGMEERDAVTIVHAAVAARSKSTLISALAGQLNGSDEEVLIELLRLANLLDVFPLPPGSPEAGMVGVAAEQRASLDFRKAVFFAFGYMNRRRAGIAAEMLGFDPELVLPQLDAALAPAQAAPGGSAPPPAQQ